MKRIRTILLIIALILSVGIPCRQLIAGATNTDYAKLIQRKSAANGVYYALGAEREMEKPGGERLKALDITADKIASVSFMPNRDAMPDAVIAWDVSYNADGSASAWVRNADDGLYDLFIGADTEKMAPPDWNYGFLGRYASCKSIEGFENLDTGALNYMGGWFSCNSALENLNLSGLDSANVSGFGNMLEGCSSLKSVFFGDFSTANATNLALFFHNCTSLEELDLTGFDTKKVTNMSYFFNNCRSLRTVKINPELFRTDNVTAMERMFYYCRSYDFAILPYLSTSKVETMSHMFDECENATELDVSGFDTSSLSNMNSMFRKCTSLASLDLSSFDTSLVTDMAQLFQYDRALDALILGENFTSLEGKNMFDGCQKLRIISFADGTEGHVMRLGEDAALHDYATLYVKTRELERLYEADESFAGAFRSKTVMLPDSFDDLYRIRPMIELNGTADKTVNLSESYSDPGARLFGEYASEPDENGICTPGSLANAGFSLNFQSGVISDEASETPYEATYILSFKGKEVCRAARRVNVVAERFETAFERLANMRIGYNLGNSFDVMERDKGFCLETETLWGNPKVSKAQIDLISGLGFKTLRLPVTYYNHIMPDGTIDPAWLGRVQSAVEWALADGMYVIINIHHDTSMRSEHGWIFADAATYDDSLAALKNIWSQVAEKFKSYDDRLMFELVNEIVASDFDPSLENHSSDIPYLHSMEQELIELIRETGGNNAERFIFVSPYGAYSQKICVETLVANGFDDTAADRLILEVHDYKYTEQQIHDAVYKMKGYMEMYDMPVLMGEFGARSVYDHETRLMVADAYAKYADETGVGICYWDDGTNYDLFDRRTLETTHQDIINAILRYDRGGEAPDPTGLVTVVFRDENLWSAVLHGFDGAVEWNKSALTISFDRESVENIKSMDLSNLYLSDITGLEYFKGVEELDISNNIIADISPLSTMKGLRVLKADGNQIRELSPLSGLTGLTKLNLSRNMLIDYEGKTSVSEKLKKLTELTELELYSNLLRYTDGFADMTKLKRLDLFDNAIRDIGGLRGLTELEYLNLGENNEVNVSSVANLDVLSGMTKLKFFDFAENRTPDIVSYIGKMTELEELRLNDNLITDVSELSKLKALKVLILHSNNITDVSPLFETDSLEELNLGRNSKLGFKGMVVDDAPVWPKIKKLDISENWSDWRSQERKALYSLYLNGSLELAFEYEPTYEVSGLPHVDENGIKYVTYEDFGARCDGDFDDAIAMSNAHNYANKNGYEVRATAGKTYHVYKYYTFPISINTNVDWQNAKFIIHDEDIEHRITRFNRLFAIQNTGIANTPTQAIVINNPDWTIDTSTQKLENISVELAELNSRGFTEYYCRAENADKMQFIRFGRDANNGEAQKDYFKIDSEGKLLNDVQWDFEKITKFTICPIPEEKLTVKNGNFITNAVDSRGCVPYARGGGKSIYFYRVLRFQNCANFELANVHHTLSEDTLSGNYVGFFWLYDCVDGDLHNCTAFARKTVSGSTYGIGLDGSTNLRICDFDSNDIFDDNRWGVTGTNYTKDILYERCRLNRIDSHQGVYNLTIRDCEVGCKGLTLTGHGALNVENTTLWTDHFLTLRGDYGSTWDGPARISDCTYRYYGKYLETLMYVTYSFEEDGSVHDFGYPCRVPDIYVENLTVDNSNMRNYDVLTLLSNRDENASNRMPEEYWPDSFVVNGLHVVQNGNEKDTRVNFTASAGGKMSRTNFVLTDCRLTVQDSGRDITRAVFTGEEPEVFGSVALNVKEQKYASNTVSLYRDGAALFENEPVTKELTRLLTQPGVYRVVIDSYQETHERSGVKELRFAIKGESAILDAETALPLDAIPEAAFRVSAIVNRDLIADDEDAVLFGAGYDEAGRLVEIKSLSVPGGRGSFEDVIYFENVGRDITCVKLFFAAERVAPFDACTVLQ